MAPFETVALQVEVLERGAGLAEGKEGRAHVVDEAWQGACLGAERAAWSAWVRFEQQYAVAVLSQHAGCQQPVWAGADHNRFWVTLAHGTTVWGNGRESEAQCAEIAAGAGRLPRTVGVPCAMTLESLDMQLSVDDVCRDPFG